MTAPLIRTIEMDVTSLAATVDYSAPAGTVPFNAVVTSVVYVPAATQITATAVASTFRTYTLYNRLAGSTAITGTGAVIIARGAVTSLSASNTAFGTGLIDNVASTLPLNSVTTSLTVAANDILEWESSHSSVGLVDPGGKVVITLSRI